MQEITSMPLWNQVAVVTGGGHGIGASIARKLAGLGSTTVICGRTRDSLDQTASEIRKIGAPCEPRKCDITNLESVQALANWVRDKFNRIDILVNNAGVGAFGTPLLELSPDKWDSVINTNLRGAYYCIRAFAPMMVRAQSGHIVNISSIASKNALPNAAAYAASKWGLNGLSFSVAEELRGHGVRVSVVCPGSTVSDLGPSTGKDNKKMLRGDDIAHAVAMIVTQAPQSFASEIVIRPTMKP